MTYLLLFEDETDTILWKFSINISFLYLFFSTIILYAGPANFDFLGQPSNTSVSLSSTQSSEELEAYYQTNLGTKSRIKWQIWKVKPEH